MELTCKPDVAVPPRLFLAPDFDASDGAAVERAAQALLERPVSSPVDLERWLRAGSELASAVRAGHSRRMIATHRDTRDADRQRRLLTYLREVLPVWEKCEDRLNRFYLASPQREGLGDEYSVYDRAKRQDADLYRDENRELHAGLRELDSGYMRILGGVTIGFRGARLTPQQCAAHLQDPDRSVREAAWRALSGRFLEERDRIDGLYDSLLAARRRLARNAGYNDDVAFRFAELHRFDYTPRDCERFHEAIEAVVVPAVRALQDDRRRRLGVERLRPWDLDVTPGGEAPRAIFADQEGYVALCRDIFERIDPRFAEEFDILSRNGLLDLMSREGKAPGGYNCPVEDLRLPFIFFNAVGRREDLRVLLHEGGHAFHSLALREQALLDYRRPPMEFCEVASMSMELFGLERMGEVLEEGEARAVARSHLERILRTFTQVALIDSFQHWVYRNEGHGREERREKWIELSERFGAGTDHEGLEELRGSAWQRVTHLFHAPFYYVEYGIAQIGALQAWRNFRRDPETTVDAYRGALALGGSRPLPDLFRAVGIRFSFDRETLSELTPLVTGRWADLVG